jgi:hypothetical protein
MPKIIELVEYDFLKVHTHADSAYAAQSVHTMSDKKVNMMILVGVFSHLQSTLFLIL